MTCWEVFANYEGKLSNSWSWQMWTWGHTNVNFLFLVVQVTQKWPGDQAFSFFLFFFLPETKVERQRFTNSKTHCRGWGLGTSYKCVLKELKAWMVKPLSAGCANTVVACWILITSDYSWHWLPKWPKLCQCRRISHEHNFIFFSTSSLFL